ncbi:hypothetical protein TNIN_6721 [Trichonephila inaurata madagascariensis]|uniref:Uncharacterized protein n=1 Tax=Trichonephila inaurata madagascariensis TaxID=2747483 RepID=A0A8X6WRE0_9ARAC|nr:hypothetical protein TNIN_6721 [Trichonephila inaurata madagascariensis]
MEEASLTFATKHHEAMYLNNLEIPPCTRCLRRRGDAVVLLVSFGSIFESFLFTLLQLRCQVTGKFDLGRGRFEKENGYFSCAGSS